MTTFRFTRDIANPRSNVVRRLRAEIVGRMNMLEVGSEIRQREAYAHGVAIADARALESEASAEPFARHSLTWWKAAESAAGEYYNRTRGLGELAPGTRTYSAHIVTDESGLMGVAAEIVIEAADSYDVVSRGFGKAHPCLMPTRTAAAISGQVSRMGYTVIDWHDDERISITRTAGIVVYGFTVIKK